MPPSHPFLHTCFLFIACAPVPKASSSSELCCYPGTNICLQNFFSSYLRWVEEMLQEPLPSAALLRWGGSLFLELLNRLGEEDLGAAQTLFLPHAQASLGTHAWACCRPQGTPTVPGKPCLEDEQEEAQGEEPPTFTTRCEQSLLQPSSVPEVLRTVLSLGADI